MGFKDGMEAIYALCALAGVDKATGKCAKGKQVVYVTNEKKGRADAYPDDFAFDAVLCDVTSRLCSIGMSCLNGAEVRDMLRATVAEYFGVHKARFVGAFFDDRRHASAAKHTERAKRVDSRAERSQPYDGTVDLRQPEDHGRPAPFADSVCQSMPLADYEFALDRPLPKEFPRVLATPALLAKFSRFVALQLAAAVDVPRGCELVVAGEQLPSLLPGQTAGAAVADEPCTVTIGTRTSKATGAVKRTVVRGGASGVGEAEGQCFHWWRRLLDKKRATDGPEARFDALVSANDTDAVACALLNLRALYSAEAQRVCGKLFVDVAHNRATKRHVDCVRLWRRLKATMAEPRSLGAPLRNDVETALLVAMLAGNDYCARIPLLGSKTLLAQFERGLLRPARHADRYVVKVVDSARGEWMIDECVVAAFMARVFGAQKSCEDALKAAIAAADERRLGDTAVLQRTLAVCKAYRAAAKKPDAPTWLVEHRSQREFVDTVHRCTVALDQKKRAEARAASKKERGSAVVPSYAELRAHIRRAFYALHYFAHIHSPAATVDALAASTSGHSLFGHRHSEFVGVVQTGDTHSGRPLQPFIARVRERETEHKKRKATRDDDDDTPKTQKTTE